MIVVGGVCDVGHTKRQCSYCQMCSPTQQMNRDPDKCQRLNTQFQIPVINIVINIVYNTVCNDITSNPVSDDIINHNFFYKFLRLFLS